MESAVATVREPGKLLLESPDLKVGTRVRYTIEEAPNDEIQRSAERRRALFGEIRQHMADRPQDFRTPEQIDADIQTEREAWD